LEIMYYYFVVGWPENLTGASSPHRGVNGSRFPSRQTHLVNVPKSFAT
jgi:hypothetical protein